MIYSKWSIIYAYIYDFKFLNIILLIPQLFLEQLLLGWTI